MKSTSQKKNQFWDKVGICASSICLVHCLITPFILLAYPAINMAYADNEYFHFIMAIFVIGAALMAVLPHCKKHDHKDIIVLALSGSGLILFAVLGHEILGEVLEHILTIIGSIIMLTAHYKNIKVRHGKCPETTHCHSTAHH